MSTFTPARLYQGQPGTSTATAFTASTTNVIVKEVVMCNTSSSAATVTVYLVPTGNSAAAANAIISSFTVQPNATAVQAFSQVMNNGDFLAASQGTASAITVTVSGVTIQ
jgi:hypothetical protein